MTTARTASRRDAPGDDPAVILSSRPSNMYHPRIVSSGRADVRQTTHTGRCRRGARPRRRWRPLRFSISGRRLRGLHRTRSVPHDHHPRPDGRKRTTRCRDRRGLDVRRGRRTVLFYPRPQRHGNRSAGSGVYGRTRSRGAVVDARRRLQLGLRYRLGTRQAERHSERRVARQVAG